MDAGLLVNVQPLSNNLALLQTLSQIAAGVGGILSLLAAVLAAIGVYGVVAYVVSRRRREVGVRMALGAAAHDVQRLILRQTLRPVVIGMSIGVAAAAATGRLLQSVLFGVSPYDPSGVHRRTVAHAGHRGSGVVRAGSPGDASQSDVGSSRGLSGRLPCYGAFTCHGAFGAAAFGGTNATIRRRDVRPRSQRQAAGGAPAHLAPSGRRCRSESRRDRKQPFFFAVELLAISRFTACRRAKRGAASGNSPSK